MKTVAPTALVRLTEAQYALLSSDVRGIWSTEREDLPNWDDVRDRYMGKRTLLHRHVLLIEGEGLEIVPDHHSHEMLMRVGALLDTLNSLYLQPEWVQLSENDRRDVAGNRSAIETIDQAQGETVTVRLSAPGGRFATLSLDMTSCGWSHFIASADVEAELWRLKYAF